MARKPRIPNARLEELVTQARYSHKGLAKRVNDLGKAVGIADLSYDHSSVKRWLDGQQPKPPVPRLVAEALSERLRRRITAYDAGMQAGEVAPSVGLGFALSPTDGIEHVTTLWKNDLARREFLLNSVFASGTFAASALRWFTVPAVAFAGQGSRRIGSSDVAGLREVTGLFRKLDNRWGGGRARITVVQYLSDEVTPMLRDGRYTEQAGRELFSAAAELTRLAGWMAYDLEQHGLAQRYLIQALQLARDGWDFALGAEVLAAMSHQALYVARPGEAVDLARAAQISAQKAGLPALVAETLIMEAHALAVLPGGRSASMKVIEAAEHQYSGRGSADQPEWLGYFDEAYLSARIAHCLRDLHMWKPAEAYARRSLSMADGYDRGRTFNLALLATIHGKRGDVEHACATGMQAVQLAAGLQSARSRRYIAEVRRTLRPHPTSQAVRVFTERARQLLPARQDV